MHLPTDSTRRRAFLSCAIALGVSAPGCQSEGSAFDYASQGDTSEDDTTPSSSAGATNGTTSATDSNSESGSDSTTGPLLDLGGSESGSTLDTCTAVDLLFVIDNSPSMSQYQQELSAAFPGFIDAIYTSLPEGIDIHLGMTSTSFSDDVGRSCDIGCLWYSNACGTEAEFGCDRDGCYNDVGATSNGARGRLFEYDGKSYFATNTQDDEKAALQGWFSGAATALGDMGNNYEFSAAAAAKAVSAENLDTNGGFLRDEGAVLFVFFLTDQWDESIETLDTYVGALTASKVDCNATIEDGNCIVTSGLLNPCTVPDVNGGSASSGFGDWDQGGYGPNDNAGDMLWQTMTSFTPEPIWGSILDTGNYENVVGDALAGVILEVCDSIPPID